MRRCFFRMTLLGAMIVAGSAAAQYANFDHWTAICKDMLWLDKPLCAAQLVIAEDKYLQRGRFVLNFGKYDEYILLKVSTEWASLRLTAIRVEDNTSIVTTDCEARSCSFWNESAEILLRQFKSGRKARIQVLSIEQDFVLDTTFPLTRFSTAFAEVEKMAQ